MHFHRSSPSSTSHVLDTAGRGREKRIKGCASSGVAHYRQEFAHGWRGSPERVGLGLDRSGNSNQGSAGSPVGPPISPVGENPATCHVEKKESYTPAEAKRAYDQLNHLIAEKTLTPTFVC